MKPTTKTTNQTTIESLIADGIPLQKVILHRTVTSNSSFKPGVPIPGNAGEPEQAFYAINPTKTRTANLWYTPHGVVIEQKGRYKIIPLANVSDTNVL